MMMMPYAETFTVYERTVGGVDDDGNDAYGESSRVVTGAFVPAGSSELVQGQATVITHDTLYLDEGYDPPGAQDEMLVRGARRRVNGTPGAFANPFTGWCPGAVVQLETVTG